MRFDILAIYILAMIGVIDILYDTGCWIYDMVMRRRCKKHYEKAQEWLGRWGA